MRIATMACLSLAGLLWAANVEAQGMFGQRNLGGGFNPGQRTMTGAPGTPAGGTTLGGGMGGGGGMAGGANGPMPGAANDLAGSLTGGERFLRQNRQAGQFVGASAADAASNFGTQSQFAGQAGMGGMGGMGGRQAGGGVQRAGMGLGGMGQQGMMGRQGLGGMGFGQQGMMGRQGMGGMGGMGFGQQGMMGRQGLGGMGMGGFGMNQGMNFTQRGGAGGTMPRTQLQADFRYPSIGAGQVQSAAATRFRNLDRVQGLGQVDVAVNDRVVVLQGRVPDERSRRLAAQLLMLEPGVDQIDNQLVVGQDSPASTAPAGN